jgi:hypothetical protein
MTQEELARHINTDLYYILTSHEYLAMVNKAMRDSTI